MRPVEIVRDIADAKFEVLPDGGWRFSGLDADGGSSVCNLTADSVKVVKRALRLVSLDVIARPLAALMRCPKCGAYNVDHCLDPKYGTPLPGGHAGFHDERVALILKVLEVAVP